MPSFKVKNVVTEKLTWKKTLSHRHNENPKINTEKEGVFASLRGSMSLEASLVIPIFMFFLMTILLSIKMVKLQSDATEALHQEYSLLYDEGTCDEGKGFFEYLDNLNNPYLIVEGNKGGIKIDYIKDPSEDGLAVIEASYVAKSFIRLIPVDISYRKFTDRIYGHLFTGYTNDFDNEDDYGDFEYVYVAKNGEKYHRNKDCQYIRITPLVVNYDAIKNMRNNAGAKYYACERCYVKGANTLYITEEGNRYHADSDCPSLKRTIYMITLKEAVEDGYSPCSKCG